MIYRSVKLERFPNSVEIVPLKVAENSLFIIQ